MLRQLRLPQDTFDRALTGLNKKLPWGSSDLDLILGHLLAVEQSETELREQLNQQLAENSRLRVELAAAHSTPFS